MAAAPRNYELQDDEAPTSAPAPPSRWLARIREFCLFFAFAYVLLYTSPELFQLVKETVSTIVMKVCGIEQPDPFSTPTPEAAKALSERMDANKVLHALDLVDQGVTFYKEKWDKWVVDYNEKVFNGKYKIDKRPLGSGDTQWNYIEVAWIASIALCFAVLASLLSFFIATDLQHRCLTGLVVFITRWYLVMHMLGYGFAKVIPTQFQSPRLADLVTTYGDMSPMGLIWRFMGFSTAYCIFCGAGEVLGGMLLAFRKTTTLGAIVVIAVMSNVVMINYCFDVPVKLFSSHLLLLALGLLLRDLPRFLDFFVFNRATAPRTFVPFCNNRTLDLAATCFKLAFVGYMSYEQVRQNLTFYEQRQAHSPLYGVYDVTDFRATAIDPSRSIPAPARWKLAVFESPSVFYVKKEDDTARYLGFELDPAAHTMAVIPNFSKREQKVTWKYDDSTEPGIVVLAGDLDGHHVSIQLKRRDAKFYLVDRGFNWVNETPNNR